MKKPEHLGYLVWRYSCDEFTYDECDTWEEALKLVEGQITPRQYERFLKHKTGPFPLAPEGIYSEIFITSKYLFTALK